MRYQIFSSGKCEILNICSIGYGESPEITHFGPGKRNLYIIHFVISGRGYYNISQSIGTLLSGAQCSVVVFVGHIR